MDFDGSFALIGRHDTSGLRAKVEALSAEDWLSDAWRQHVYRPHRESNTILLMFDKDYRHDAPTVLEAHAHFAAEMEPIYARLKEHYGTGYPVRALFARLPPEARVHPHSDAGFSLTNSHRVHLPVVTHPAAWFTVGGETRAVPYGELWEINNQREHSVYNQGDRDRVHLLVDWVVPGELRFFRPDPRFIVHMRLAPGAKVDTPLGRPHLVVVSATDVEPVELTLTREIEPLARWLRMQKGVFTQHDVSTGVASLSWEQINEVLDTLVRAEVLQHSFKPFTP
jgi:hypothetical protein